MLLRDNYHWLGGDDRERMENMLGKIEQALTINATFLALATPTTAQTAAQVQRLTRENNALIRLLLSQLDDTAGT